MFCKRSRLNDFSDLNFGLVANAFFQFIDQPIDLLMIFLPLVARQSQHIAVVKTEFRVRQRHGAAPPI